MHSQKIIVALLVIIATMSVARAQVPIRVLATHYGSPPLTLIPSRMAQIQTVLNNSNLGILVDLVAGGVPVPLTGDIGSPASDTAAISSLILNTDLTGFRDANFADLVIVFMPELVTSGRCGFAPNYDWFDGQGMDPIAGPDLRGQETHFVALISTDTSPQNCLLEEDIVAHEFGHLFGAAHEASIGELGLLPAPTESYADLRDPDFGSGSYTVMSTLGLLPNAGPVFICVPSSSCQRLSSFSRTATSSNPPLETRYNNSLALSFTSFSVELYRTPPLCGLATPVFVGGSLKSSCDPDPWYQHNLHWVDTCPSASSYYEIWAEQPIPGTPTVRWTVGNPFDVVFVRGRDAKMRVGACGPAGCTLYSISSYVAWVNDCH